jgi:hypothetical protein
MKPIYGILGTVVAVFAIVGTIEWRAATRLRGEIGALRVQAAEASRLRSEQGRLQAAQASEAELKRLRAESEEVQRLRSELGRLRQRAEERARVAAAGGSPRAVEKERAPTMSEDFVPCAAWKNAGQATPADAMETALWAAAGGDLKTLAAAISLEPAAREKALRLLERLPQETSTQFHTAEDFIALLTTNDVPLSEAHLPDPKVNAPWPDGMAVRVVEFRDEKGNMRYAPIVLRQVADKEWRLSVPPAAIDKYAAVLVGAPMGGGTK